MKLISIRKAQSSKLKTQNQSGLTSIVVVFVLVVLLTIISVGFTKVMNRSLQNSAARQQAAAADYAAQSGINDAAAYLKKNPSTSVTQCDDLIKANGPLAQGANLSGDGTTGYSCVLVDPSPTSLLYQDLQPYKSQVVKLSTTAQMSSILFSWQSSDRTHNQLIPANVGQVFYDETTWGNQRYAPPLRLSLYPLPASGDLSGAAAAAKTFFLYPQTGGGNTGIAYSANNGLQSVNCSSKNLGSFSGSADYDCNLVITNLPAAGYYYARLTPLYDTTQVKIKANDAAGQVVKFTGVQTVVDVTAKSGGATKRLQARVNLDTNNNIDSGSDNLPEFGVRSAELLCKRLLVPADPARPVAIDPGSLALCPMGTVITPPPSVSLSVDPSQVRSGQPTKISWSVTNADSCTASGGWSGPKSTSGGNENSGNLTAETTFTLTCRNIRGDKSDSKTVKVYQPPTVNLTASPDLINKGESTTLSWSSQNTESCEASNGWQGGRPTNGSERIGNIQATTTYVLTCTGKGGSAEGRATVVVRSVGVGVPTLIFTADKYALPYGAATTLRWTATNVTWCWGWGSWGKYGTGDNSLLNGLPTYDPFSRQNGDWKAVPSGTFDTGRLYRDPTYWLQCGGPKGDTPIRQVIINVNDGKPPPRPTPGTGTGGSGGYTPPDCRVYDWSKKYGDCEFSSDGGRFIVVKGCTVLVGENYEGGSFQVDPSCSSAKSITLADALQTKGTSGCPAGTYRYGPDAGQCAPLGPENTCPPGTQGNPLAPGGCTKIEYQPQETQNPPPPPPDTGCWDLWCFESPPLPPPPSPPGTETGLPPDTCEVKELVC